MKMRIAWLAILCLTLAATPALAQIWGYDNGPINGNTDAWTINFGYIVSDTFTAGGSVDNYNYVAGFSFGVWEYPGDKALAVGWSITSGENSGTVYGSGQANVSDQFLSTNSYGYDIDLLTVTGLNVAVTQGTTYWLNLQNAVTSFGDPLFWDENSGVGCKGSGCPSMASESSVGTIPGEAFTISGACLGFNCTPEPSSIMLFGSGILGVAGVLRRKLHF